MNVYEDDVVADEGAMMDMLRSMGFDKNQAKLALDANHGDVDRAVDQLLSGQVFAEQKYDKVASSKVAATSRQGLGTQDTAERTPPKVLSHHPGRATSFGDDQAGPPSPPTVTNRKEGILVDSNVFSAVSGINQQATPHVGAVAVEGPRLRHSDVETGDCESLMVARAVSVNEIRREQTRNAPDPITAELVPPESFLRKEEPTPYWTKRRILLAALFAIALILVGCAIAGALLAINKNNEKSDDSLVGHNVGPTESPPPSNGPDPTELPAGTSTESPAGTTEDPMLYTDTVRARSNVGDRFADHVVISRDASTIAAGAEVGNYVQVYRHSGAGWDQVGQTLLGEGEGDQFGRCVDLNADGSMVIVGAWNNDHENAQDAGHAKVFRLVGDEWKQVGQSLLGDAEEDRFGWYVSMSDNGETIAVSAREGNANGKVNAGYVRVFSLNGSDNWEQLGKDLEGESEDEQFGRALAMSANGQRLAVGTTMWNQLKGIVRIFDYTSGNWNPVGQDLIGARSNDWFGSGIALSANGNVVAVGADGIDTAGDNAGLIRIFHLEGCCTWKQYGQDILGEGEQARLGMHQVSLSDDGCCLAGGAYNINNGEGKGYLYSFTNNQWVKIVELSGDIPTDQFGESVSLSGDCMTAVFGASQHGTTSPGYFRVYYANHEKPC